MEAGYFLAQLSQGMEVKDLDAMWPVGVPAVGSKYGAALAERLDWALSQEALLREDDEEEIETLPTTYLVASAFLTFGMLTAGWKSKAIIGFLERYLTHAASRKAGDLFNRDGRNILWTGSKLSSQSIAFDGNIPCNHWKTMNHISCLALALSESLFFCCHRISTERHGPYEVNNGDNLLFVRSVINFPASDDLWPELSNVTWPDFCPFHLGVLTEQFQNRFDMFSNFTHDYDINKITRQVSVIRNDLQQFKLEEWMLHSVDCLTRTLQKAVLVVESFSEKQLEHKMVGILCFANRALFKKSQLDWRIIWEDVVNSGDSREPTANLRDALSKLAFLT